MYFFGCWSHKGRMKEWGVWDRKGGNIIKYPLFSWLLLGATRAGSTGNPLRNRSNATPGCPSKEWKGAFIPQLQSPRVDSCPGVLMSLPFWAALCTGWANSNNFREDPEQENRETLEGRQWQQQRNCLPGELFTTTAAEWENTKAVCSNM